MFPLLLRSLLGIQLLMLVSVVLGSQAESNGTVSTIPTLSGCMTSCGDLTFSYPFGIGPNCSRGGDFELTCNESPQPPTLLLHDGITQVAYNIVTVDTGSPAYSSNRYISINFPYTIPVSYGVHTYNMLWSSPGNSFTLSYILMNITGCDFDIYFSDQDASITSPVCTLKCPTSDITDMAARQNCNGTGCCPIFLQRSVRAFYLKFVRESSPEVNYNRSSLWDYINVTTVDASLSWNIVDQPNCASAKENNAKFACVGNNSQCIDGEDSSLGYSCKCNSGYVGNPYILSGCLRDRGYNPTAQLKANCSRVCGNIKVPFPFGIEEGCFAREQFFLNCINETTSTLQLGYYLVTEINIDEGLIKYIIPDDDERSVNYMSEDDLGIFVSSGESVSMKWVVANLTCQEAQANSSGYACVSANSNCIPVNSTSGYVGYRCNCSYGFQGNPYLHSGCEDVDECKNLETNPCSVKEACKNTIGGFECTCPPQSPKGNAYKGTCEKDPSIPPIPLKVTIPIGIFACLLVGLLLFLIKEWIKHKRRIIRHEYLRKMNECFQQNGGQLLMDMMKVESNNSFQLYDREEIEVATNNFDNRSIIGEGGQGTVYTGQSLDAQNNPVAIKICKGFDESRRREFGQELLILSRVKHENIVQLLGCSLQFEAPVLVYEYVPNQTLHYLIHRQDDASIRTLEIRHKIATEIATALAYLHSLSHPIFHGDIKSVNILIGHNLSAKLSDFGCSMIRSADDNVQVVKGTMGYLDPEYLLNFELTDKSDVYSFGVVLLELLTRRKALSETKESLVSVFTEAMKDGKLVELIDTELASQENMDLLHQMAALARECLAMTGQHRPMMSQVAEELQGLAGPVPQRTRLFHGLNALMLQGRSCNNAAGDYTSEESTDYYSFQEKASMSTGFAR